MANDAKQYSATEETGAVSLPSAPTTSKEPPRSFLAVARRNLTAEELASPGTLRMLVAEIERLDVVCDQHETMVEKYHDQRVEIAALSEQSKTSKWHEILTVGAISIGSGLVGAAPSYFQIQGGGVIGGVVLAFGIALTVLGVVSKVMR